MPPPPAPLLFCPALLFLLQNCQMVLALFTLMACRNNSREPCRTAPFSCSSSLYSEQTVEQILTLFTSLKQHAPVKGQSLANIRKEGHVPSKDVQALYNTVTLTTNHQLVPPQLKDWPTALLRSGSRGSKMDPLLIFLWSHGLKNLLKKKKKNHAQPISREVLAAGQVVVVIKSPLWPISCQMCMSSYCREKKINTKGLAFADWMHITSFFFNKISSHVEN